MGMEIDRINTPQPRINVATVRATLENVRGLLKLFDDFDDAVRNVDIVRCCDTFLASFKKTLDSFGDEFNDNQFLDNYIAIPLDAYTTFECLYKDDEYLTNSLSQYAGRSTSLELNLESLSTRARDFKEIYECVLKEGRVFDGGELAQRLMREFYKRFEVLVKVLYHLSYKSFQFLTIGAGTVLFLTPRPNVLREVKLAHILECYNDLGLFGYFVQLFETFCESFLRFRMPRAAVEEAERRRAHFDINLHLRNFSRDAEFTENLVKDIRSGLYLTNQKLLLVDKYLKFVAATYERFDATDDFQLNMFEFESNLADVLFSRMVFTFYEDLCDRLAPLLPLLDAVGVVECLREILDRSYANVDIKYLETYLHAAMNNWDSRFLQHVRHLANHCGPGPAALPAPGAAAPEGTADELKFVNFKSVLDIHTAFMHQFFKSYQVPTKNAEELLLQIHRRLSLLHNIQKCAVTDNLHTLAVMVIRLAMTPIVLDHELTQHTLSDRKDTSQNARDERAGLAEMTKSEVMELLVERNANLTHNAFLMYTIGTEHSVSQFIETLPNLSRDPKNVESALITFIVYISNLYFIGNLAIVLPYLMQSTLNLVYSLRSGTAVQFVGDCNDSKLADTRDEVLRLIRTNYKMSASRVPVMRAMDFLVVHLCCFSQQHVAQLVGEGLQALPDRPAAARAVGAFLARLRELTARHLPPRIALVVLTVVVDLTYRDLVLGVLDHFEALSHRFTRPHFARVAQFLEAVDGALSADVLTGVDFNFNNREKFASFVRIFRGEPEKLEAVFAKDEQHRVNRLARQAQMLN